MAEYGAEGADKLKRIREALGRRPKDILQSDRESRTRSELSSYYGPPTDVIAPSDQDMWEEEEGTETTAVIAALPPPEYVNSGSEIVFQATVKPSARPDLYSENYNQGSINSTRIYAMQWIPTAADEGHVIGDVIVAFARASKSKPNKFYVYPDVDMLTWQRYKDGEGVSLGRFVGGIAEYYVLTPSQETRYKALHSTSKDGVPWDNWIFEKAGLLAGRPFNSTAIGEVGKRASRAGSKRRSIEASKATKAAAREEAKRTGGRSGRPRDVSFDEPGSGYRDDNY